MKKTIIGISTIGFLSLAGVAYAQMGMMGGNYWYGNNQTTGLAQSQELNSLLQDIYKSQNISSQAEVDCGKVTDSQFEKLGDAYMGIMLPNENQHEAMDNMMGGEGSASLTQAHINMGRSYLGCWSNYNSGPVYMPMMSGGGWGGYGFNNGGNGFGYPMMFGWGGYGTGNMIFMVIWSAFAVIGVIALIKWIAGARK